MASSTDFIKKQFGHCKIKWQIDHLSLQTFEKEWTIQSPEFTGNSFEETVWFMSLRSRNSRVYFSLERSAIDSGPNYVCVNLKVHNGCRVENSFFCKKMLLSMRKGSKYEVCLGRIASLVDKLDRLHDLLTITCNMIVYNQSASKKVRKCINEELKLLSENMHHLYASSRNFDIKLIFGNNVILAHKVILCARNRFLNFLIVDDDDDDIEECSTLDFTGRLDYVGMKQILTYLYDGDIMHVLEKPSFSILDCATFLGITEIKMLYEPDELNLKTSVDVEERTVFLHGYKLESGSLSWRSYPEGPKQKLQLLLYPNGERNENYISLFTGTFEKRMYSTLRFDFSDKNGYSFTIVYSTSNDICNDEMISKAMKKINSKKKSFDVAITMKLSAGTQISDIIEDKSAFVSCIKEDFFYRCLSEDMELLLDEGTFRDLLIDNNGTHFWVHKCILASRSRFLSDMLDTKEEGEIIDVLNVEPHILFLILTYVYSGRLPTVTDDSIVSVYVAAVYGKLFHLKSLCSDLLKESFKINKNIRCRVVKIAEVYEDVLLKKCVLTYLFEGGQIVVPNRLSSSEDVQACRHCR